jgi:hypothetical protein
MTVTSDASDPRPAISVVLPRQTRREHRRLSEIDPYDAATAKSVGRVTEAHTRRSNDPATFTSAL